MLHNCLFNARQGVQTDSGIQSIGGRFDCLLLKEQEFFLKVKTKLMINK